MRSLYLFALTVMFLSQAVIAQRSYITPKAEASLTKQGVTVRNAIGQQVILEFEPGSFVGADDFLRQNGELIGLGDGLEMREVRRTGAAAGEQYLRYQVFRDGVAVLGEMATMKLTAAADPQRVLFHPAPSPRRFAPAAAQKITDAELAEIALRELTSRYPQAKNWNVTAGELTWTSSNPWAANPAGPLRLTRAYEATEPDGTRGHVIYLDPSTGKTVFDHQTHCHLNRRLYHTRVASPLLKWEEGDAFPGGLDDEDRELLTTTAETYNLFNRTFLRNSYDGADGRMRIISRSAKGCPNASAGNGSIEHCTGVVSDDIIAHEWTHNYVDVHSGLIYRFESGAINEAYADIFGEIVDLLNGRGNDAGDNRPRNGCGDAGLRWKIGEDATAFTAPVRDMYLPECYNNPGSRTSGSFLCNDGSIDDGGVHINSGVVNRSFSLLVDGGNLNGVDVTGVGLTKAAHIYYHAVRTYVGPTTDFQGLAAMLLLSADDLAGKNLAALTVVDAPTPFSGQIIDNNDREQLNRALIATGMLDADACQTALPVTYTHLHATARKRTITVDWATAAEVSNEGFYVERKEEHAVEFTAIGFVPGADDAGGAYAYEDGAVVAERTYLYRLRQIDWGGSEAYSTTVSATLGGAGEGLLRAYPNPVSGLLTILSAVDEDSVELIDPLGRLVLSAPVMSGRATVDVAGLAPGAYALRAGEAVRRVIVR